MAKTTKYGFTDAEQVAVNRYNIPYDTATAVKIEEPNKTVLVNIAAPLDQPETLTTAVTLVKDVYRDTGIDPSVYAASKQGFSLVAKAEEVLRVTDSEDGSFQVDLPVSAHVVLKAPNSQYVSEEILLNALQRALGLLYEGETPRVAKLIRGSMTPSNL